MLFKPSDPVWVDCYRYDIGLTGRKAAVVVNVIGIEYYSIDIEGFSPRDFIPGATAFCANGYQLTPRRYDGDQGSSWNDLIVWKPKEVKTPETV